MKVIGISVADIRVEPKFESERDSQLIYGEEVEVLSEHGEFVKIRGRDGLAPYRNSQSRNQMYLPRDRELSGISRKAL